MKPLPPPPPTRLIILWVITCFRETRNVTYYKYHCRCCWNTLQNTCVHIHYVVTVNFPQALMNMNMGEAFSHRGNSVTYLCFILTIQCRKEKETKKMIIGRNISLLLSYHQHKHLISGFKCERAGFKFPHSWLHSFSHKCRWETYEAIFSVKYTLNKWAD